MKYEYDYEPIFNEEQISALEMGLTEDLKAEDIIKAKMNSRAKEGWEAMTPIQLPCMWFKREKTDV
jgi:hypothetical protein